MLRVLLVNESSRYTLRIGAMNLYGVVEKGCVVLDVEINYMRVFAPSRVVNKVCRPQARE
jgi:hypothetical protein